VPSLGQLRRHEREEERAAPDTTVEIHRPVAERNTNANEHIT
jgi:hypothetical protein